MEHPPSDISKILLAPLAWLYKGVVNLRLKLYEFKILKRKSHPIPVICVGNITVGGTGKTPHIEYLIRLLSPKYKVAVLSRGYKRRTRGFREVQANNTTRQVGDEPLQIKQKFPEIRVFVDKNRNRAIEQILRLPDGNRPEVILMDDGFQHLSIKPSLSILLMDNKRPIYEDRILPLGRLREPIKGKDRASIVIVTKCSSALQPIDFRIFENGLDLFPYQSLFFTSFDYGELKPVFPEHAEENSIPLDNLRKMHVILVSGIAVPQPLIRKLGKKTYNLYPISFEDHHEFNSSDIQKIKNKIAEINDDEIILATTEKDAKRFQSSVYMDDSLKKIAYYIPIKAKFVEKEEQESFNKKILEHVRNYQTNL